MEKRPSSSPAVAVLITLPAAYGMAQLEGDFAVEDFLDESSDFAIGVDQISKRFADEGEPCKPSHRRGCA